jgi:hypothetical protein
MNQSRQTIAPTPSLFPPTGLRRRALIDTLERRGYHPRHPAQGQLPLKRHPDFALYRERNLVELFFGKLKGRPRHRNSI